MGTDENSTTDGNGDIGVPAEGASMSAWVRREYGPAAGTRRERIPVPSPGRGEVLLRLRFTALNAGDVRIMLGDPLLVRPVFGIFRPRNPVRGMDVAGEVVALGEGVAEGARVRIGDEVVAELPGGGGLAPYATVAADRVTLRPAGLAPEIAACLPIAAGTAWQAWALAGLGGGAGAEGGAGGVTGVGSADGEGSGVGAGAGAGTGGGVSDGGEGVPASGTGVGSGSGVAGGVGAGPVGGARVGSGARSSARSGSDSGSAASGQERAPRVLVLGASGGVGVFAVQLAALRGAEVWATCGERNRALVERIGAVRTVDHRVTPLSELPEAWFDAVVDVAGGVPVRSLQRLARDGGTVVLVTGDGGPVLGPIPRMIRAAALSIGSRRKVRPLAAAVRPPIVEELVALADAGRIDPVIERVWDFADAPEALAHLEEGHAVGKTVVRIGG
ncbi:NADPH:quinone reductase-like Zn-dependent oxidoreductase [Microbacterium resistens]|uniref:NADPH:quinone reductase-like Zn-dependent oxidoreductase n=1 Tax=Microbacterium resistens TaxID=156977 RepID=A0ABU1SB46_9MICO|nr:NAD(P)-dependent alcohol dehydrogenase [Microbacterium resistens]MDR6866781.1 NADPH:quinone reductase-like Zn-dependent oxidoreductase [Microbacterium resistens]